MLLSEEYFARHNIKVPLIRHLTNATLFIRADNYHLPTLVSINFRADSGHGPGRYTIRRLAPSHDGLLGRGMFETLITDNVEWDEYEDYIIDFINSDPSRRAMVDSKDIILAAWEMFVYCCDSSLCGYSQNDNLYKSIDSSLEPLERHMNYALFLRVLQNANPDVFEIWHRDFLPFVKSSCQWLAKLVDENRK